MSRRLLAPLLIVSLAAASLVQLPAAGAAPGDFVSEVTVPVPAGVGVGIAFDGTTFYYTNNGDPTLYGYTLSCVGTSCTPTLTVSEPIRTVANNAVNLDSVTWDSANGRMFGANGNGIWQLDPATGLATHLFNPSRCMGYMDGLAYDGVEDVLYFSPDATSNEICKFRPDGSFVGAIPIGSISAWPSGCGNSGLAVGGDHLYFGTAHCGRIVRSDKTTLSGTVTFSSPGGRDEDIECDPVTFPGIDVIWSKDAYNNKVTAFQIEDDTCGLGGTPPCQGEASITILDPEVGYDYAGAVKTPQSPVQPYPRVTGIVPVRAAVTSAHPIVEVRFFADAVLLGVDTSAPYEAAWDTTLGAAGTRNVRVVVKDTECTTTARQPAVVFCGTPLDLEITRPAPMKRYFNDVESPGTSPIPLVAGGPLTLTASASDPGRITRVDWLVDGIPVGFGAAPAYAASWASELAAPGVHDVTARFVDIDPRCTYDVEREVRTVIAEDEAIARALWIGTTQPAELVVRSSGASGNGEHVFLDYENALAQVRTRTMRDTAETTETSDTVTTRARSVIEGLELLGGRITIDVLASEAETTLTKSTFTVERRASVQAVGLVIDGVPFAFETGEVHDIPGVGRLALGEVEEDARGAGVELSVAGLHLYGAVDGFRGEVILSRAIAGVAADGLGFVGETHRLDAQDDAGTGSDVGGTRATALAVTFPTGANGARAVGGRLVDGDVDAYRIAAAEGQKLHVDLKPSETAHARTNTLVLPPSAATIPGTLTLEGYSLPDLTMRLVHETRGTILVSDAPLSLPERLELNVDDSGPWYVFIEGDDEANYTLDVSVTPIVHLAETTTGAGCGDASAPLLSTAAPATNAMHGTSTTHWYQLTTRIGDDVSVALTMPDADGADFDLATFDETCALLASSTLGKSILWPGDVPKGVPDAVVELPSDKTQTLWVRVTRYLGVGNYVLHAQSNTVIPDAPQNDALTGADAGDSWQTATPLGLPAGAWSGRFEDGDAADAYSFVLPANARAAIAFSGSPANTATMSVVDGATGASVAMQSMQNAGYAAEAVLLPSPVPRTIVIVLTPSVGGGNYAFTVASSIA